MEMIMFLVMLWVARQCFQYALTLLKKMLSTETGEKKES